MVIIISWPESLKEISIPDLYRMRLKNELHPVEIVCFDESNEIPKIYFLKGVEPCVIGQNGYFGISEGKFTTSIIS